MSNYDFFFKYYDLVMGDRTEDIQFVKNLIQRMHPDAKSILELACGTGIILGEFKNSHNIHGIDISEKMLSLAKARLKDNFSCQDITSFQLNQKFDIILCLFDSINHIIDFSSWKKVFDNSYDHLADGGIFIFDINTKYKLKKIITNQNFIRKIDDNFLIFNIQNKGDNISNWNIKIFEHLTENNFKFFEENIYEKSFSLSQIKKALKNFKEISIIDKDNISPIKSSERLYLICKK